MAGQKKRDVHKSGRWRLTLCTPFFRMCDILGGRQQWKTMIHNSSEIDCVVVGLLTYFQFLLLRFISLKNAVVVGVSGIKQNYYFSEV